MTIESKSHISNTFEARIRIHIDFDIRVYCFQSFLVYWPLRTEHLRKLHPSALIVKDVAELANQFVKDVDNKLREQPEVMVLFAGISCKGLSGLNQNPESVLGRGSTGTTLRGLYNYVLSLPFERRPRIIILENVSNMAKKRQVEQGDKICSFHYDIDFFFHS